MIFLHLPGCYNSPATSTNNARIITMKKFSLFFSFLLLVSGTLSAQGMLSEAMKEILSLGKYDTVTYFGIDVSRVRINDAPKIPRSGNYSKVYPAAWIAFVEKEMSPDGYIRRSLPFSGFRYDQKDIFNASVAVDSGFIIGSDHSISPDTIRAMVAGYKIHTGAGLGLVLIPELFSKPMETSYTWVVFFDIRSRKILYSGKTHGRCSHMGYTAHWASGIIEGYKRFAHH
jgi:hypothetical protein